MIAVIQMDGLGAEPLERLLAAGEMPNLAAALASDPAVDLSTPAPLFPAAVYPTLYSGLTPGEHGLVYPFQWDPDKQAVVTADRLPKPEMVWQRIGAAGGRSLIIDPYECTPAPAPGARVISGWQLTERVVLRRFSRPRSMWPAAFASGPRSLPPRATETFGPRRERELAALANGLLLAPDRAAALLEHEIRRGPAPDLLWVGLIATHIAGHRLWESERLDALYRATDQALGRILSALPAGCRHLIVCPIGMEADTARADLLPEMLARVLGEAPEDAAEGSADSGAMWRLRAAVPAGLRSAVASAIPAPVARELTARLELRGVDWSRTRAFAQPSDNQGYVRLNLHGRERDGIVDPGSVDALAEEISAGLSTFCDEEGRAVVEEVVRTAEAESGERVAELPDLVVRWAAGTSPLDRAHSSDFGTVIRHGAGSGRNGNHPGDGAWVSGADVPAGQEPISLPGFCGLVETIAAGSGSAAAPHSAAVSA